MAIRKLMMCNGLFNIAKVGQAKAIAEHCFIWARIYVKGLIAAFILTFVGKEWEFYKAIIFLKRVK